MKKGEKVKLNKHYFEIRSFSPLKLGRIGTIIYGDGSKFAWYICWDDNGAKTWVNKGDVDFI